jgi:hypothetical protein
MIYFEVVSFRALGRLPVWIWDGRDKLVAGVGASPETPDPLLPEGPDPSSRPQYLGVRDAVCQANAGSCHQTFFKVIQVIIHGKA